MKLRTETIDPARLSTAQREALCTQITDVTAQIFEGVTYERIRTHVVEVPADRTQIRLYYGPNDQTMGYSIFHQYHRTIAGRRVLILRGEAGLLPEARGHRVARHVLGTALKLRLRHPFVGMFYLDTLVHASSYSLFHRYTPVMYPAPNRPLPPALAPLVHAILETFPDPTTGTDDPMVRKVGWITRETKSHAAPRKNARQEDSPGARFFKSRNPGYVRGEGLIVVIPVTGANIIGGALRVIWERVTLRFRSSPDL